MRRIALLGALALGLPAVAHARMFGDGAPQNVPIAELAVDYEATAAYAAKLWNGGGGRPGLKDTHLTYSDWTYPRYALESATTTCTVRLAHDWGSNLKGAEIPFNPKAWVPSHGWYPGRGYNDSQLVLQGPGGREYDLWQVRQPEIRKRGGCTVTIGNGNLTPIDWRTSDRIGFASSRGSGTVYSAALTTGDEVAAGRVDHALALVVSNSDPAAFREPATKTDGQIKDGIPEGTRFGVRLTPDRIEAWLASLPACVTAGQKSGLRAVAIAEMVYGLISVDQTGGGTHIQLEDKLSAGDAYRSSGFLPETTCRGTTYPRHGIETLLNGPEDIYVVQPFAGR